MGVALLGLSALLFVAGQFAALYVVVQYSFLLALAGVALALTGWSVFRILFIPLAILVFMIPLPEFLLKNVSAQLQLLSSQLGVWIIRIFGISVFLEGNVIDLGAMKLQVVEACSGLRYLFPLLAFGFITAYFYKVEAWKRALVFVSTVPITIVMNSIRIGLIGVTVEYWGPSMAEGLLHDFEGWIVFMACTAVLLFEMWLLTLIGSDRRPLRAVFGLEFPASTPKGAQIRFRSLPRSFIVAALVILVVSGLSRALPQRAEIIPARAEFAAFPNELGDWKGKSQRLSHLMVDTLKFDDYLLEDYVDDQQRSINAYVAYYASQKMGQSAHSPRACLPGGGWQITDFTQRVIEDVSVGTVPLSVNRAVIQYGDSRQLVYYWFQGRGRVITSEYLVKWYLFWDALTKNRTDGSLVRLTTPVTPGEDVASADARLRGFARVLVPKLDRYVPG
jgi:exosortase D (VPLPA-CTERM-specific)